MRPGHAAGRADRADHRPPAHAVALGDADRGQVREVRVEPPAVVDDHDVAGEVEIGGHHHHAVVRRLDRRPLRGPEIGAAVGAARLAVEYAAAAEGAVRAPRHRPQEPAAPVPHGGRDRKERRQPVPFAQDPLHDLGRRIDVARGDAQSPGRELLRLHRERVDGLGRGAVDPRRPHGDRVLSRLDVEIDPDQRRPDVRRPGREEPQPGAERGGPERGRRLGRPHVEDDDLPRMQGPRPVRDGGDQIRPALPGRRVRSVQQQERAHPARPDRRAQAEGGAARGRRSASRSASAARGFTQAEGAAVRGRRRPCRGRRGRTARGIDDRPSSIRQRGSLRTRGPG